MQFHTQRITEMFQNMQHMNLFPFISTFTFNNNGSAVMSMYPKLPLYLYALIRLLVQEPITSYYIGNILRSFICLVISYYSFLVIHKDQQLAAFLFSTAYSLSALMICCGYNSADLGISFSLIFFPVAFAGFYCWLKNGSYRLMTLGVSAILLCHLLNFIFTFILLLLLASINFKILNKGKIVNLAKSFVISVLLTSSFWLPALRFGTSTAMNSPFIFPLVGVKLFDLFQRAFTNDNNFGFTIIAVLGLFLGAVDYKYLDKHVKQLFWASIIIVLFSSQLFPWQLLQNTPVRFIQFPWRFLVFPQLFLTYIYAVVVSELLKRLKTFQIRSLVVGIITVAIVLLSFNAQDRIISSQIQAPEINYQLNSNNYLPSRNGTIWFKVTNEDEFNNLMGFNANTDYLPKKSSGSFPAYSSHWGWNNDTKKTVFFNMNAIPDGSIIQFDVPKSVKRLTVPFVIYNDHYQVILDNKKYPLKYDNNVLYISNIKRGKHIMKISYHDPLIKNSFLILTILGTLLVWYEPQRWERLKSMIIIKFKNKQQAK